MSTQDVIGADLFAPLRGSGNPELEPRSCPDEAGSGRSGRSLRFRILIACEFSGTVREAFRQRGHDAWSCDLLPTEIPGPHICGDVLEVLREPWDMVIAHPPCTYLTVSANKWLKDQPPRKSGALVGRARREAVEDAVRFFMACYEANSPCVCVENPIGIMGKRFRAPDQIVQPWMFGHGETKATCFWLRGLRPLDRTHRREDLFCASEPDERTQRLHLLPPGPLRWKERSKTFLGIAQAMALQWGGGGAELAGDSAATQQSGAGSQNHVIPEK